MTTTAEIDYNTKRKLKLLQEILAIVMFPRDIKNLVIEGPKEISFDVDVLPQYPQLGRRYLMRWDKNLNFLIFQCGQTFARFPHHPPTTAWFRVGRLLDERHLDGEALKQS